MPSADVVTVHGDATAADLPAAMAAGGVRPIPVVDDDGRLVAIATPDDVVATVGELLDDVATTIELQSREFEPDDRPRSRSRRVGTVRAG